MTAERILVCGLNGAGKSTFGKALAEKLGCPWLDIEDFYFPGRAAGDPYASSLGREEVSAALLAAMQERERFVLSSVIADYGEEAEACLELAVFLHVPDDVRMARVRSRSYGKFGDRMLPGGDLYEQEERFFDLVKDRSEDRVSSWLARTGLPVLHLDGTLPVERNIRCFLEKRESGRIG